MPARFVWLCFIAVMKMPERFSVKTHQDLREPEMIEAINAFVAEHEDSPVKEPEFYFHGADKAIHMARDANGNIVGLGFSHTLPKPGTWKLNAAIVRKDLRRRGTGTEILRSAILWLKEKGATAMVLPVTNMRYAARLETLGVPIKTRTPSQIVFEIRPASPSFNKILSALEEFSSSQ